MGPYPDPTRRTAQTAPLPVPRLAAASLIVTSNKPFGRWGEVFGEDVVAAAMIDRLVHYAEVISMKGDSYRLKDRDLGRVPASHQDQRLKINKTGVVKVQPEHDGQDSGGVDTRRAVAAVRRSAGCTHPAPRPHRW
ncbi:hypothetical protein GCM10027452_00780 [Micromonospora halotolerans]